jgi:hypothetical protein
MFQVRACLSKRLQTTPRKVYLLCVYVYNTQTKAQSWASFINVTISYDHFQKALSIKNHKMENTWWMMKECVCVCVRVSEIVCERMRMYKIIEDENNRKWIYNNEKS